MVFKEIEKITKHRDSVPETCVCGKEFTIPYSHAARGQGKFCSKECYYNSLHRDVKMVCEFCGEEFFVIPYRVAKAKFCSIECMRQSKQSIKCTCLYCNEEFFAHRSAVARGEGYFCSRECYGKYHRGKNHSNWRGGKKSIKYCPAFNEHLREEIRDDFGRRCFLSGAKEEDNGRKLSVHHCDYFKSQGCQGQRWSLLPMRADLHAKTNFNRWYWFALLRDYWVYKYLTFHGMDIFDGPDRTAWLWEMYDK